MTLIHWLCNNIDIQLKGGETMSRAEYLRQWRKKKKDIADNIQYILEVSVFQGKTTETKSTIYFRDLSLEQALWIKSKLTNNLNILIDIKVK